MPPSLVAKTERTLNSKMYSTSVYPYIRTFAVLLLRPAKFYKQKITASIINQVSVGLVVSADACTQVVQGSNPTDGWKIIGSAIAFSAVAFKMILKGTCEGAHTFCS